MLCTYGTSNLQALSLLSMDALMWQDMCKEVWYVCVLDHELGWSVSETINLYVCVTWKESRALPSYLQLQHILSCK